MTATICKHCGKRIGTWRGYAKDPSKGWIMISEWMHDHMSGPDAYSYCGDEYGTDAEPIEPQPWELENCFHGVIARACTQCAENKRISDGAVEAQQRGKGCFDRE